MPSDWRNAALDDVVADIIDRRGVTPLKLGSDFVSMGHRVISAKLLKGRRIDLAADDARFVDAATYHKWMKTPLLPDDVIVTSEAPLGELAYVHERLEWCLGQRLFAIRTRKDLLHGRFLYYALQHEPVVQDLRSRATGTTVLGVRQTELRRVHLPIPPLSQQRAIAHVLGALDDKIELARKTNETLEAMARALFKSWFVDFDLVGTSTDGRRNDGNDQAAASLFPDAFDDTELGTVPRGWRIGPASELQAPTRYSCVAGPFGSNLTSKDYVEVGVPVIRGSNLGGPHVWLDDARFVFVSEEKANALVGNLAFPGDVVFTQRGTLGQVALIPMDISHHRFVLSQSQMKLTVDPNRGSAIYVAMYFQQPHVVDFIVGNGQQAGVPHVNLAFLREFKMLLPPPQILRAFDERVGPLFNAIRHQAQTCETLAAVRDALLPELMSGALRVPADAGEATNAS